MASLKLRGKIWYVYWWENGKRRGKPVSESYEDALKEKVSREALLAASPDPKTKQTPWPPFKQKFLEFSQLNKAPRTFKNEERALNLFDAIVRPLTLESITVDHVEHYKLARVKANLSPVSINSELRHIKVALRFGEHYIKIRFLPEQKNLPKHFREEELKRFANLEDKLEYKLLGLIYMWTGVRPGELVNILIENIRFEEDGVWLKVRGWETYRTKNKRERHVFIAHPSVVFMLRAYIGSRQYGKIFNLSLRRVQEVIKDQFKRVGIEKGTIKAFRHTFLTLASKWNIPLPDLQSWAGHSTITTTMIYTHVEPERMKAITKNFQFPVSEEWRQEELRRGGEIGRRVRLKMDSPTENSANVSKKRKRS
jgi:integrase